MEAEKEWIPYIAVVGRKEQKGGTLTVRIRGEGQKEMFVEELAARILSECAGFPSEPLPLPPELSRRPKFR